MLHATLKVFFVSAAEAGWMAAIVKDATSSSEPMKRLNGARMRALHAVGLFLIEARARRRQAVSARAPHQSPGLLSRRVSRVVSFRGTASLGPVASREAKPEP